MAFLSIYRELNHEQRHTVLASFLGWMLDAFDFFVLTFALKAIAADFQTSVPQVALAVTLTLAMRPLGALVFGRLADRYGRRPVLMVDVLMFSAFELASAFAPTLGALLVLRALFGFAMGGEWGIGASLALEAVPERSRGLVSGLLQEGYACGNLLAAGVFALLFDKIGWRGMFIVGAIPAFLTIYIRSKVPESPVWLEASKRPAHERHPIKAMRGYWKRALYMIALMTAFNFFSHGSQDLYPTFLQVEHGFDTQRTGLQTAIGNVGAILGGLFFGAWSQRIGRRRGIVIAALLALPMVYPWAFGTTPFVLGVGAFLIQFMVQGAWGIVPVHLNELSPTQVRATLPGLTYQIGNLISAGTPALLAAAAEANGKNYGLTMGVFIASVAVVLALLAWFGPEAKGVDFRVGAPVPDDSVAKPA